MKVTYIQHCGDDLVVVNAARVSFKKESEWIYDTTWGSLDKGLSGKDKKLIKYLADHKHYSPFNHTFITMHVKAPLFVARQLVKHEYMPFNEVSRRYVSEPPEFYYPDEWRKAAPSIKQGSSEETLEVINKRFKKDEGTPSERRNPASVKFDRLRWRVQKTDVPFDLEPEDVIWNRFCPYLGIELNYETGRGGIFNDTACFDRLDPTKGYVKNNVQTISDLANRMKSNATEEQLMAFVQNFCRNRGYVVRDFSFESAVKHGLEMYTHLLEEGVCPEQARMVLPQNMYTEWYWSGTLGAWAKMYNLRAEETAQKETQEIARQCGEILEPLFPVSWRALCG